MLNEAIDGLTELSTMIDYDDYYVKLLNNVIDKLGALNLINSTGGIT